MIAWVDEQCRAWSAHKRWLENGVHGYPPRSVLGRLIEEGPGASHGSFGSTVPIKDSPPAYTLVSIALQKMAATHGMETEWKVLHMHYLQRGKARGKALDLGISVEKYWQLVQSGHAFIAGCSPEKAEERAA